MITQKPISLKIAIDLLEELDTEVSLGFPKRNWHINRAIRLYLKLQSCRRLYRIAGCEKNKQEVLNRWMRDWFPEAATW